jgi:hypothetical protein
VPLHRIVYRYLIKFHFKKWLLINIINRIAYAIGCSRLVTVLRTRQAFGGFLELAACCSEIDFGQVAAV